MSARPQYLVARRATLDDELDRVMLGVSLHEVIGECPTPEAAYACARLLGGEVFEWDGFALTAHGHIERVSVHGSVVA